MRNGLVTAVGCLVVPMVGPGFGYLPAKALCDAIAVGLVSLVLKAALCRILKNTTSDE